MKEKSGRRAGALAGKVLLSGLLAFIVLTLFSVVYYKVPPHYDMPDAVTYYVWKPHTFHCTMREGLLAHGYTNNEGYANPFDYTPGLAVETLIMGASHLEAFNVNPDQSVACLLGEAAEDGAVYNLALSSYPLIYSADALQEALDRYHPSKYVIMDIGSLSFTDTDLQAFLNGTLEDKSSRSAGLEGLLQEDPYIRLLYKQAQEYVRQHQGDASSDANYPPPRRIFGTSPTLPCTALRNHG